MDQGHSEKTRESLAATVYRLEEELDAVRKDIVRLDADLDESRRLNLRAAELLDIVYEHLGTLTRPA